MQKIETLLRFLRYTTGLDALCWDGTARMLEEVEERACFSRQAQPLLTAGGLQMVLAQVHPGNLYEMEDLLGIHFFFFLFEGSPVLVGPFVTEQWSADGIPEKARLANAGLSASRLLPYKLYYCSYCVLEHSASIQLVTGAITALLPNLPPYTCQRISGMIGQRLPDPRAEEPFDFDSAVHQFELEKHFFELVSEGQTEAALEMWERMKKIPIAEQMFPFDHQRKVASLTGLRLVLRMVAEASGVHPAVIHAISVAYAQKIYAARDQSELDGIVLAMIREFSEAVQAAHSSRYSPGIGSVVSYLDLHISQKPDPKQLAALAGCTPDLLRQRFREETGLSIQQYLVRQRCRIAADLLRKTDLPVQKVSAHVGYLDNNYFVKVFKKELGETPTDYRNRFRP